MKKKRLSIAVLAFVPLFLVTLGVEIGTFFAGYQSVHDADYQATYDIDKASLLGLRMSFSIKSYDILHQVRDIYNANPRDTMPKEDDQRNEYYALYRSVTSSDDFAILARDFPKKQTGDLVDYYALGWYDEAKMRFVVVYSAADQSFLNPVRAGYFFPVNTLPEKTQRFFYGEELYDYGRDDTFFTSGEIIGTDEAGTKWWIFRQTSDRTVYRVSNLFRDSFLPIIFGTFGLMVAATFILVYFFLLRPIRKLSDSSNEYVDGLKEGQAKDVFVASKGSIQTETRLLNDSLYYMQDAIKDYGKTIEENAKKTQQIESELRLAERIQSGMVPSEPLRGEGFDCFGLMIPAKEVGGDFYDYFRIDDHRIGFLVGDVSGKGVPAALFMARAHTVAKLFLGDENVERINATLCQENAELLFVTAFFAIVDLKKKEMAYINCGHEQAYLRRDGKFVPIDQDPNMPLGYVEDFEFVHQRISLKKGDAVFIYTDGLSEATNAQGELFGRFGIDAPLNECEGLVGESLLQAMWDKAKAFVGDVAQSDDACMVLFELSPE